MKKMMNKKVVQMGCLFVLSAFFCNAQLASAQEPETVGGKIASYGMQIVHDVGVGLQVNQERKYGIKKARSWFYVYGKGSLIWGHDKNKNAWFDEKKERNVTDVHGIPFMFKASPNGDILEVRVGLADATGLNELARKRNGDVLSLLIDEVEVGTFYYERNKDFTNSHRIGVTLFGISPTIPLYRDKESGTFITARGNVKSNFEVREFDSYSRIPITLADSYVHKIYPKTITTIGGRHLCHNPEFGAGIEGGCGTDDGVRVKAKAMYNRGRMMGGAYQEPIDGRFYAGDLRYEEVRVSANVSKRMGYTRRNRPWDLGTEVQGFIPLKYEFKGAGGTNVNLIPNAQWFNLKVYARF